MGETAVHTETLSSQQALCIPEKKRKHPCCSTLTLFTLALSFAYFAKTLAGTYMKSSITQIERRFDLSSSLIGVIDGSFEIGNLLFLATVSYFGAKLHRPRLIAVGYLLMAVGAFLTGLPHFFMGRYAYDTAIQGLKNDSVSACAPTNHTDPQVDHKDPSGQQDTGCVKDSSSYMWMYVFLGNALRGIGETPVTPLGISYIDDFAKAENSPFYIACLQTITLIGHMFGFLLGSFCAKLYVDIGYVDMDSITITAKDARWVGAWWLGFLVSSVALLLAGIPFWFLPRSLPEQGGGVETGSSLSHGGRAGAEDSLRNDGYINIADIAKDFLPSLKRLLGTPAYFLLLCGSVLKFNSLIGLYTFKAKYMEQQFGQSASRANFLIGVLNLPVVAVGIFLGGLLMRRYKLSLVSGAQLALVTSLLAYLLGLLHFGTKCDNVPVAGLTVSYNGSRQVSYSQGALFSECNRGCSCSGDQWDPVCSEQGITYTTPCMAGCHASTGHGRNTVFHNCSCVSSSRPAGGGVSVVPGQCPRPKECSRSFASYMAVSVLSVFISSLGATPGYMVILRCISPELKSLALGIHALAIRTLGGLPGPVYFGALIDSTCLKWAMKKCGGRGACRLYDANTYRLVFLGLMACLSGCSYFFVVAVIVILRRQAQEAKGTKEPQPAGLELQTTSSQGAGGGCQRNAADAHTEAPSPKGAAALQGNEVQDEEGSSPGKEELGGIGEEDKPPDPRADNALPSGGEGAVEGEKERQKMERGGGGGSAEDGGGEKAEEEISGGQRRVEGGDGGDGKAEDGGGDRAEDGGGDMAEDEGRSGGDRRAEGGGGGGDRAEDEGRSGGDRRAEGGGGGGDRAEDEGRSGGDRRAEGGGGGEGL